MIFDCSSTRINTGYTLKVINIIQDALSITSIENSQVKVFIKACKSKGNLHLTKIINFEKGFLIGFKLPRCIPMTEIRKQILV